MTDPVAPADDEDEGLPKRERWLRLALITVGAALVASIFSLYAQRSDDDPSAAAGRTEEANSGVATIDIEIAEGESNQAVEVTNRFSGDDLDTTLTFAGDADSYASSVFIQQYVVVDGTHHYRVDDAGDWAAVDGPSAISLGDAIDLPAAVVGWSGEGLETFTEALGLPDELDDGTATVTITVAEARGLATLPVALEVLVGPEWEWADDQPIEVTVALDDDGRLDRLSAEARDDDAERFDGPLSVSTVTRFSDLDLDVDIDAP